MARLVFAILLILALPVAAPAAGLGEENCRATRAILSDAIAARRAGQSAEQVKTRLSSGDQAVAARYVPTVAPLVDLAFSLDRSMLTEKVAEDYEAQCLKYDP